MSSICFLSVSDITVSYICKPRNASQRKKSMTIITMGLQTFPDWSPFNWFRNIFKDVLFKSRIITLPCRSCLQKQQQ